MSDGTSFPPEKLYSKLLWIVFIGSLLIYLWGIWAVPTLSFNEARRMVVVQEMVSHHSWLIPTLNGQVYVAKPPLFYWLALLFSVLFRSTAEWVIRLPSALSALGLTWLLFHRVRSHLGKWPALFSALILITSSEFSHFARRAEIEMVFTTCCACAVIFYYDYLKKQYDKKYLYLSYIFLGLAFLTKGPVALVFFLPPILVFGILQKDKDGLKGVVFFRGWIVFTVLAFPWYLYIILNLGRAHLGNVIQKDIIQKILGTADWDSFLKYPLIILGAFAPWILILAYKTKSRIRTLFSGYDYAYFSYAFLIPLIIMSFFSAKRGKYILPILPPLAIFLGIWISSFYWDLSNRWKGRYNSQLLLGIIVLVAGHFFYYSMVEARIYRYRYEAFQPVISKLRQSSENFPVYCYKHIYYRLIYYYGQPMPVVSKQKVKDMISKGERFLLVAENKDWDELEHENLYTLTQYKPFIKKNMAVRIFSSSGKRSP